jgi:PmbA protein
MNLKKIRELIEEGINPSSWEIRRLRKKSFQRYLIFKAQESQRVVENEKFLVTLYKKYERDGQEVLGESTLALSEGDDAREKLSAAWEMAGLVANPVFVLPEKGLTYPAVQSLDPEFKEHPLYYLDRIRDDLVNTPLDRVKLSSAEIFLELQEFEIVNSLGLEQAREESEILVEFVLLAEQGAGFGGESWGWKQARFYPDLQLDSGVRQYARFARESQEAALPRSGTFPVVFSEEALDTLFNYFMLQASGAARFQGWSRFELGQPVLSAVKGDALTLTSNPLIPGFLKTRSFDDQGLPLTRVEVIKDNIFQQRLNTKRYAAYLQETATGGFANLEMAPGEKSVQDFLQEGPVFHLLRFSAFEPNPVTGAFSGEIRTGYFLEDGRATPIKGGSVSGVMHQAFQEAYFSSEITRRAAYLGPEAVRLEGLDIAGE